MRTMFGSSVSHRIISKATRRPHVRTRGPLAGWLAGLPDKSALGRWEPEMKVEVEPTESKPRSARKRRRPSASQRKSEGGGGGREVGGTNERDTGA